MPGMAVPPDDAYPGHQRPKAVRRHGDEVLLASLAAGQSTTEAAAVAGMSARTARRRAADPGFRARLDEARAAIVEDAAAQLAAAATDAVSTLRRLLTADSDMARLGAARAILDSVAAVP